MPGIMTDGSEMIQRNEELTELNSSQIKDNNSISRSQRQIPASSQSSALDLPIENCLDTSIDRLYDNVCEMESSSNGSPSRQSFGSDGEESRIDSELRHLVGVELISAAENEIRSPNNLKNVVIENENKVEVKKSPNKSPASSKKSKKAFQSEKQRGGIVDSGEDGPELGPFLLKHARELISSDNHRRALKYALRAAKVFEKMPEKKGNLDLVMSLHVIAAIQCNLGKYNEAINFLKKSIEIPDLEAGREHALAKFSGFMQLGDTYAMLGQLGSSIQCYTSGLDIQKEVLGDTDPRVGETCRYLAEAHVQALQFDDAEKLCRMALDIHKSNGEASSLDETADRRLMGLICETKGDHEAALEHLIMASMSMVSNGQDSEMASVDCSIGDIYLSLGRYDEAIMAYQKALSVFKSLKGENHPNVASVFIRLADLYNRTGKFRDSRSHCENALRIYGKPMAGTSSEEIAGGFADVSAIYESMSEHEQALKLLQKALKMLNNGAGQKSYVAGIEAQIGVLHYILGNYSASHLAFKNAVLKFRACGEKKSVFFGIALNQMGIVCAQRYDLNEAAELFEEARGIFELECGLHHPDTLGVYSNLAGTYDAMGRLNEAIDLLEHVVNVREVKLGTANPDVDDEKRRLAELLKEAGRVRNRKVKSLEHLLDANSHITIK